MARDFWRHSGFHLLERAASGQLELTDDFLRAYYLRPELRPVETSCASEIELHHDLMREPRRPVAAERLEAIADADARDNYRIVLAFRERLLAARTLEACYLGLFVDGKVNVPPLFIDQLAQIILRNVLEDMDDPLALRAAELFYREQKASLVEGAIMLADLEILEMHASRSVPQAGLGQLISQAQAPFQSQAQAPSLSGAPVNALDVLDRGNAELYWQRDERHDFVVGINHGRAALDAFCRVLERWILHLGGVNVSVRSVARIDESRWSWHIGLDAQSSALLNDLWNGAEVEPQRYERLLALFRMDFADAAEMRAELAGRPVYLALSKDRDGVVRMKPQNLLINLPLAHSA